MPAQYPGNATTKAARAKAGGGFESAIEAPVSGSFTPLVADDFSAGTLEASISGWRRSVYSNDITPLSGTQCNKVQIISGTLSPSCEGSHFFGGRPALPQLVTEGYTVWQRIWMYFPAAFSFGYLYGVRETTSLASTANAGDTRIFPNTLVHKTVFEGMAVWIKMDDNTYHFSRIAAGGAISQSEFIMEDPLPSIATAGNFAATYDEAEARNCGKEADMGNTGIKWVHFTPNAGSKVLYTKIGSPRRQINQGSETLLNYESEVPNTNASGTYAIPRDQWVCFQMAVKVASDNTGWARIWINNELKVERLNIPTISASDGATALDSWGIGDYWNGLQYTDGAAGRGAFYIDDCIVATDMPGYGAPTGTDAAGNAYIDPATRVADLT